MTSFAPPHTTQSALLVTAPRFVRRDLPHPSTHSFFKRLLDIAGSLIGLLALALLVIPVAIAIKLDSPGPVFYTQRRCGLYGRQFTIFKFRTMIDAAPLQPVAKQPFHIKCGPDARVTRVGSILRKTSLDEFPQFWNVLMGDMSLVGTRPPTVGEVTHYAPHHWRRLNVRPGLTGEWQVSGRSNILDFEEIVSLDLRYQARWTPLYDLRVLWKTVGVVLLGTGAL